MHVLTDGSPYVPVDVEVYNADIYDKETLWEQLRDLLREDALKRRMRKQSKKKGRPAKGPASSLGDTPEEITALIRATYAALGQDATHIAVAKTLGIAPLTLWRWRRAHPEEGL